MPEPYTPPERPRTGNDFEMNNPTVVALLHLAGILTGGLVNIVAVILAYSWKGDARSAPWMVSHYRFHIRTFWYAIALSIVGVITLIIGIGFLILALIGVYIAVRSILALMAAQRREPIARPEALFW